MKFLKRKNSLAKLSDDPLRIPFAEILERRRIAAEKTACKICGNNRTLAQAADDHNFFGLHFEKDYAVFREYAPNARSIVLTGDFSDWKIDEKYQLAPLDNGVWEGKFPRDIFPAERITKCLSAIQAGTVSGFLPTPVMLCRILIPMSFPP